VLSFLHVPAAVSPCLMYRPGEAHAVLTL
jgi:hypothetical protein